MTFPLRVLVALSLVFFLSASCAAKFRAITSDSKSADADQTGGDKVTLDLKQVSRAQRTDLLKQGAGGDDHSENFMQAPGAGVLDILVVIDNSGSMGEEQANLSTRLEPLLQYVTNSDWRIGVMTTDANDPCLRSLIMKGDADPKAAFQQTISTAGTAGSGSERGMEAGEKGLNCAATPWVRQSSTVAVLIVSDEDNCSRGSNYRGTADGGGCPDGYPYNTAHFLDFITNTLQRIPGKDARVYGIFHIPGTACNTALNVANEYNALVTATTGTAGSICANDYTPVLQNISLNISEILKSQFALADAPTSGTVLVTIDGTPLADSEYTIADNVITFVTPPPNGATVEVSYKTGFETQLSTFALSDDPMTDTVEVEVGGILIPRESYAIDYAAKTITFASPPAAGSGIKVLYRTDSAALKTEFVIGEGISADTLIVMVNGVVVSNYTYDSAAGTITFAAPPPDDADIHVEYAGSQAPPLVAPVNL